MPTAPVNGIEIYFEVHGEGPPLMYISGTGDDLRRSPASVLPVNSVGWQHCHVMGVSFGGMVALNLAQRWDPDAEEPIPGLGPYCDLMVESARSVPEPGQLAGLARQLRARAGHDVLDALSSIEHPTLVCAGDYDGVAPVANSVVLADGIPHATLRVFDSGQGFLVQDRTAFPEIIGFLRGES